MAPEKLKPPTMSPEKGLGSLQWDVFTEKAGIWGNADFSMNGFVDHLNATKDSTDYLWYTTRFVLFCEFKCMPSF